ncbi:MAG TPA: type II toxin-antitoxin system VapC family toxin [Longimicrobium sp.]|nr:type II toxin-antitoxin system VapC family toxin [Longimicrobium sp.]
MGRPPVIVIDTHIWIWWVDGNSRLSPAHLRALQEYEATGIGVSAISCWEIAKLVEYGRIHLSHPVQEWLDAALSYPGIELLPLSPTVAVAATTLPEGFHKDPADQIIVATARVLDCPLLTADEKILAYQHVRTLK